MTATRKAWTDSENAALVALYFTMLDAALMHRPYCKAAMIRDQQTGFDPTNGAVAFDQGPLFNRTKQSIEFKLMNASAAHGHLDPHADTMDVFGYRAMPNYQASLKDAMQREINMRAESFDDLITPRRGFGAAWGIE